MKNIEKKLSDYCQEHKKKVWKKPCLILLGFSKTKEGEGIGNDGTSPAIVGS